MAETEIPPKSALELQIEMETKELKDVPKIPIVHFMGGPGKRCHLCGKLVNPEDLRPFETQSTEHGPLVRMACPDCHPNRGH